MEQESIGRYITAIFKNMTYYLNDQLADYNLKHNQISILYFLYNNEGISQKELGAELRLDKISVSKRLQGLVKEGYIYKELAGR